MKTYWALIGCLLTISISVTGRADEPKSKHHSKSRRKAPELKPVPVKKSPTEVSYTLERTKIKKSDNGEAARKEVQTEVEQADKAVPGSPIGSPPNSAKAYRESAGK